MLLKNKKALVTGGTAGIGKAIATCFVQNGADVVIFGTNDTNGQNALEELNRSKIDPNQTILFKNVDVSQFSLVEQALSEISISFDILVNNAGITKDGFIIKMSEEDWDRVIDVNLKSVFNTSRVIARSMIKAKRGKIINISSVVGLVGGAAQVNYAASKAGMIGLTKALAKELARKNICVNAIAPGYIESKMTDILPEEVKEKYLSQIPLNRYGNAQDVANAALFLASDLSNYITGQVLTVDGGMVM